MPLYRNALPSKIVSGGQTGVDRAALDFALERGMECGGWCPAGRESESGPIPERYPLAEVGPGDYNERTRRNVLDSDATLVITSGGKIEPGTRMTIDWAGKQGKPCLHLDLQETGSPDPGMARRARHWLVENGVKVLNLAGNRESTSSGIGLKVIRLMGMIYDGV